MEYRSILHVDKPLSKIVLGCANSMMMSKPQLLRGQKAYALLDAALDAGINTFDTAENYGYSEIVLGKWIKKRRVRDKVVLITKGCHPHGMPRVTPEALKEDLEKSFNQLKTDYIDIYMLHRDHPKADVAAIVEVLNEYHKEGKIGAFGASNWTHTRIAQANQYALEKGLIPFSVSSPNFGPAMQVEDPWGGDCVSIAGMNNADVRRWYAEKKIPVFAYSCLGRGMFSGKVQTSDLQAGMRQMDKFAIRGYWCEENIDRLRRMEKMAAEKKCSVAQLSLAYVMQQDFDAFPIVTISDSGRIAENVKAVDIKLSDAEIHIIESGRI